MTNMIFAQNLEDKSREIVNCRVLRSFQASNGHYRKCSSASFSWYWFLLACLRMLPGRNSSALPSLLIRQAMQSGAIGEAVVTGNGIEYNGGPVMLGPHNVYFIWYGNFSGNSALTILPDLINGLAARSTSIPTQPMGMPPRNIANTVTMAGQIFDNYSQGTALNGTTFNNVLLYAIQ